MRPYQERDGNQLTEGETKAFVLMHCFGIVPKLIKTPVALLKVLLSLHSRNLRLPDFLSAYLLESPAKDATFTTWPVADILPSREKFLGFLQDEWALFLASLDDPTQRYRVPFNHEDVRAYTDTFFLDGSLTPVEQDSVANLPAWVRTGVVHDPKADALRRFHGLRQKFEAEIPSADASHREWQQAAQRWAELVVLRWEWDEALDAAERTAWRDVQVKLEEAFGQWMMHRYGSLHNLPYHQQPVMVHQIPRFIAVERTRNHLAKIALLVLDGLAFDQWLVLRKNLESFDKAWRFQESTAFAWVPTLTSVSRQSIFAAELPLYFPDSFVTTSKERAHWLRFWEDQGVQRAGVELVTNVEGHDDPKLETALANPRLSILGVVWNKVDDIMHGMQMQTAGMHNQVRLWASQGHLQRLLARLYAEGFALCVTADHGNVTATGIGNPQEGVLVETRRKRARVYDSPDFRDETAAKFAESIRWPGYGLPPNCHVLLPRHLTAFTDDGDQVIAPGGIALEEVMVPFVAMSREQT